MVSKWLRVDEQHPCRVCHKTDWCIYTSDGRAAICPRVPSEKEISDSGYLHILNDNIEFKLPKKKKTYPINWNALNHFYKQKLGDKNTHWVTIDLECGTDSEALTYPMKDADFNVVGIQRRFPDGQKKMVKGSKNGLFIPTTFDINNKILVVCEGVSDTMEALMMGYNAIGRASCKTGCDLICKLVNKSNIEKAVVVADNDKVGIDGANSLALKLVDLTEVKVVIPPEKDLRESIQKHGAEKIQKTLDFYVKI